MARFHLVRPAGFDGGTFETTYKVVSRHRTKAAAERAGEALHRKESRALLPHRTPTITTEFRVRDTLTGTESSV